MIEQQNLRVQTNDNYVVYWVRLPEHTDYNTQGYVGITNNFGTRMRQHERKAPNAHFQNAINKYGWENLIKEVIVRHICEEEALLMEETLRPEPETGWNCKTGGIIGMYAGFKHTDETKSKMSKAHLGKVYKPKTLVLLSETKRGSKNPQHNPKIHLFFNEKTKRWFLGTRSQLRDLLTPLGDWNEGNFGSIIRGTLRMHKGWTLVVQPTQQLSESAGSKL